MGVQVPHVQGEGVLGDQLADFLNGLQPLQALFKGTFHLLPPQPMTNPNA